MVDEVKHVKFGGTVLILGFGSIGEGVLPLLLRHIDMPAKNIVIVTADERGKKEAEAYGIRFVLEPLTRANYVRVLDGLLKNGDFLINVSVEVSSIALIEYCQGKGVLYVDTCIEPWPGGYTDSSLTPTERSNYGLREAALALRPKYPNGPTTVLTHGANPGLVSHFVKQALLDIARATGHGSSTPRDKAQWGALAHRLGMKVVHIAERDTQVSRHPKQVGEFVNTWSVDGFVSEGSQPAELGWGTHEKQLPHDGRRHSYGSDAAIYLQRPGASTRVRTWTPLEGPFHGFLITHGESISIADYFAVKQNGQAIYRPTVHYSYHPCDAAVLSVHELAGKNWELQENKRIMMEDIVSGIDELGVLLMGHAKGAYWFGSVLSIEEARAAAPYNNATSLQVTAAVLGAVIWAMENPTRGIVEPDDMPFERIIEIARPYLGTLTGSYSDWTPLDDRERLFPEELDRQDPWQFKNVRVV